MHMVYKKPQSPRHDHEPSQYGLVPWSQSEALGPAVSLGCTALCWGVIETDLSFYRRPDGAELEAVGINCTRDVHTGCWGKCFLSRVMKV